ncbi:hypothetical protein P5673_002049 [Acropora cervicornis]|uniref:Uncharacterized protein n=1 Tax=Acropora cervicornis TaxID=6130 RepID=A0AAD9R541_ACRCE|nr:hypothetical protein P5673_002049 [Acropora cervicornis]
MLRENVATIVNKKVTEVRLNPFSARRQRRPRKLYFVWNAQYASIGNNCLSKDASILSWAETRRER